jgi:hypothetical protein
MLAMDHQCGSSVALAASSDVTSANNAKQVAPDPDMRTNAEFESK